MHTLALHNIISYTCTIKFVDGSRMTVHFCLRCFAKESETCYNITKIEMFSSLKYHAQLQRLHMQLLDCQFPSLQLHNLAIFWYEIFQPMVCTNSTLYMNVFTKVMHTQSLAKFKEGKKNLFLLQPFRKKQI